MKTNCWHALSFFFVAVLPCSAQLGPGATNSPPGGLRQTNGPILTPISPIQTSGTIGIQANGAVAQFAPHKAFFAPNPNTAAAVQLTIPDGSRQVLLKSHVVGIGFWDSSTGETVLFATLQDSVGEVSGSSVRYTNALDGTDAEINYTYAWDSFDQTMVLRKKIPEPSALNMTGDPAKIRLVVITEFIDPPEPVRLPGSIDLSAKNQIFGIQSEDSIPDETLFFGSMRMAGGKMLLLGDSTVEVPSGKSFETVNGSHYLLEFCPWLLVKALVDSLPTGTLHASIKARGDLKSLIAQVPKPRVTDRTSPKMRFAFGSSSRRGLAANKSHDSQPGVVLDYLLVSSHLIDVDLSGAVPEKLGVAAVGRFTNDFWITWLSSYGSLTNLLWSDQLGSGAGLAIAGISGGWGNGVNDPMYNSYLYANPGGSLTLTLTNMPTNVFNFYLYGHENVDIANASFKLLRAGQQIAYKGTTLWGNGWNSTNWEPGLQYQVFKTISVTNQTIQFQIPPGGNGYSYANGLQIVESAAVPPPPTNITNLFDVNFGSPSTNKVGFAAVGLATNDYWNGYYNSSNLTGSIVGLSNANGTASSVGLTVLNSPGIGSWNGGGNGDGMYTSFLYATNGGNVTLLLTNLTTGNYDFYLYGHGNTNDANTIFQLWSGGRDWDVRGTTIWGSGHSNSTVWDESQQYIVYHDIPVDSNQVVTIVAGHDPYGSANLNGMQIVYKGSYDTNSDGLPDVWEWYYFGSTSTTGTADFDNDKLSNLREFQLGTDPTKWSTLGNSVSDADNNERVWLEDYTPSRGIQNDSSAASPSWSGAIAENWNWTSHWSTGWNGSGVNAYSYYSTSPCHCFHVSDTNSGVHQHWFDKSVVNMMANTGEVLITYVNIDPNNIPSEIMLQWYATETNGLDSWEHRAYWGSNAISWGTNLTASRWYVTNLPSAGTWTRLEVPASAVGLEGKVLQGMAFTLYNGRAAFDHAGKFIPDMDGNGLADSWEKYYFGSIGQDPNGDPDHDGLSNLQEYLSGSNPTNCDPPQISSQPQNSCAYQGGTADFSVTPSGWVLSSYKFQWRLGGTNLAAGTNISLVITNVQTANLGNYTVVVSNACGSITSAVATLTFCPPPYVQITAPTNNATFTAPAFVTIQATATNTDSSVTNVEFYRGNLFLLGHATASPYSYTWTAAAGLYSLTAVAHDSHGLISTSSPVSITVGSACSYTNDTYSSNNAFGGGFLMNLNYTNAQGRLQLNSQATPFHFINVACGADGMLVRVDTDTGTPVGAYYTAPTNKASYPGHVAVDRYGNAWVANWDESGCGPNDGSRLGSIARIGIVIGGTRGDVYKDTNGVVTNFVANTNGQYLKPPFIYSTAIDRDGDGYIKTSRGTNNVLSWTTNSVGGGLGSVLNADDECIINYVRVPAQFASALAVDANNDVWVGGYCDDKEPCTGGSVCGTKIHVKVNGVTGEVVSGTGIQFTNDPAGPFYGGFEGIIGQNGFLWSSGGVNDPGASAGNRSLVMFDPVARTNIIFANTDGNYGMDIDPLTGNVWVAGYDSSNVVVYSKTGARLSSYSHGDTYGSGVAIDNSGNVWISHGPFYGATNLARMHTDGSSLTLFDLRTNTCSGVTPGREVCFDAAGKVWTLCASSPHVVRVNPASGQVEICEQIGTSHQSRGDLTGYKLLQNIAPSGIWSVIYTNGATNQVWGTLTWTASTTDTNQIRVEVRAANTYGQLSTNSFQLANDSVLLNNVVGQLLEIRVTLIEPAGVSTGPWLHDLTVDCTAATAPAVQITSPTNNQLFVFSPTNILITATGSDTFGTITNVAFYVGSNLIGQTNQAPYQCLWTNVTFSTNTITAKATNNYGLWATSSVTNIIVNAMPLVTFLQPVTNTTAYKEVTNALLQVTNYDVDGTVTNVAFICSGTNIGGTILSNNSVWSLYWSNRLHGEYAITAVATDNRGASSTSQIRVFNVNPTNQSPFVWITYPTNNAVFPEGVDLTITANASNRQAGATITNVEFFVNRVSIGSDPTNPYAVSKCCWKAGTYVILAKATDSCGASYISAPITNTVIKELITGGGFWDPTFHLGNDQPGYLDECTNHLALDSQDSVQSATVFGSDLYLATNERQPSSLYSASVFKWDGTNWFRWGANGGSSPAPCHYFPFDGYSMRIGGVATNDTGLYVAGCETNTGNSLYVVKQWDGVNWTKLGDYFDLKIFQSDADTSDSRLLYAGAPKLRFIGADLYLYGNFACHTDTNIQFIAKWDAQSSQWQKVGDKLNAPVLAVAELQGRLIVGGLFTAASGDTNANCVAQLISTKWSSLGTGIGGTNYSVDAYTNVAAGVFTLAACDTNLFVGGDFTVAGDKTNANGIAVWNGLNWNAIGNGLLATNLYAFSYYFTNATVFSISPHGNSVYVGGFFNRALNSGASSVAAASIAKAVWSEDLHEWTWYDLDFGVYGLLFDSGMPPTSAKPGVVTTTAIVNGTDPGAYDVFVGGFFRGAGSSVNQDYLSIARWRVGYPQPPGPPLVVITNPVNLTFYTNVPASIDITAIASSSYTNIDSTSVEFFVDGASIGDGGDNSNGSWTATWYSPTPGPHLLTATAKDIPGLKGQSSPVLINIIDTNSTVKAVDDLYVIMADSPPVTLNVLTNDTPAGKLRVDKVYPAGGNGVGTASPNFNGSSIIYKPTLNRYGTDIFIYEATDGTNISSAFVTVKVRVPPFIALQYPIDQTNLAASTGMAVSGATFGYDTSVTNVTVFVNGALLQQFAPVSNNFRAHPTNFFFSLDPGAVSPQSAYGFFSTNWSSNLPGYYTFEARGIDSYGYTNSSGLVTVILTNSATATNLLIASIDNLDNTVRGYDGLVVTNIPVVRDGLFDLLGKARDPISTDPVSYRLLLLRPEDNQDFDPTDPQSQPVPFANVTPLSLDPAGFHPGGDVTNSLGRLDLSGVPNGTYDLLLTVRGGASTTNVSARFRLDSQLKIGQFSFSEQDLVIPVNGIPLTVTRTYSSLNPRSADFGFSWTYALNGMDVELDEQRQDVTIGGNDAPFADDEEDDNGLPKVVSIRTGGGWDVTLDLPNGRRTTFAFTPDINGVQATAKWAPPVDVHATLTPLEAPDIDYLPSLHWRASDSTFAPATFDNHDIPGWVLTNLDGTAYFITRGDVNNVMWDNSEDGSGTFISVPAYGPPQLTSIVQRSGDVVSISTNGILHYHGSTTNRSILFDRDEVGRITAIWDPNSLSNAPARTYPAVRYVYNQDTGNLLQVLKLVDRSSGTYVTNKYHYDNPTFPHYITSIENPLGIPVVRNLFNDAGQLIGIIDPSGRTNVFAYDLNARTKTVYDRSGYPTIYGFDARGNITNTIDALTRQTARTFDDNGNLTSLTGPLTNTYRFTYDPNGNQTSVVDPLGNTNYTAYNSFGQPTAITNALGFVTQFQYDDRGNVTNRLDALNHHFANYYDQNSRPIIVTDALDRTNAVASYDSMGNLTTFSNSFSGSLMAYAYDANGNGTGSSNFWVNPNNPSDVRAITNHLVNDAQNRETSRTDPDGNTISIAYNGIGQEIQTTDQYNKTNSWVYDLRGNVIQITHSDGTVSQMVYDENDRVSVSDDNHVPGEIANGTRLTYDAVGQVIKLELLTNVVIAVTTDASGSSSAVASIGGILGTNTYRYDLGGRQIAVTNALGNVTRYEFDAAGRQTAIIDALSNRTDYVYDAAGRLIFTTNALGRITQSVYDQLGRPMRTIYPDGSFVSVSNNAVGQRLFNTNQFGIVTAYTYSDANRLTNIVRPSVFDPEIGGSANPQWGFSYDSYGQLASVTNPKGRITRFTFDPLGRMLAHTLPMGQTASQMYDNFGRMFRKVDFKGQTNEFIYDTAGRLATNQFYAVGSSTPTVLASFSYDSQDRVFRVVEPRGTNGVVYDKQGNVLQIASPEGAINYEYEAIEGRRTRIYTTNTDLRYSYDELGRVKTVSVFKRDGFTLGAPEVTTNTYTALGSLQDVYYPNGIDALYQYDVMNRLTNLVYTSGSGQLLAQYIYAPNTNGQWKAATEVQWQSGTSFSTNQFAWLYDNLGRLTNETCSSTAIGLSYTNRYVFDISGNRLWQTNIVGGTTQVTGYTYNTNDQLLVESGAVSFTNLYDANGSLTNRTSGTETNGYVFNLQNRLASATIKRIDSGHSISETISYTYNYTGNRVIAQWSRSVDSGAAVNGTNIFLNERSAPSGLNQVLEESSAVGSTPTATYTLGNATISQKRSGIVSHLLQDGHGSTRLLSDTNAGIAARFTYDAYGKPLDFTADLYNTPSTKYLYSGSEFDADLQRYNLGARYYDPRVGRFGQIDPFSAKQQSGANLYVYCEDDPVNSVDPTGMYEIDVHQYLTRFLAQAAGFTPGDSSQLGIEAQRLDEDDRVAIYGLQTWQNMANYHFVTRDRLADLAFVLDNNAGFFRQAGEFFHAQEDSYAHCVGVGNRNWRYDYGNFGVFPNGIPFGHALQGHNPDFTWNDPNKAIWMARRVYEDMRYLRAHNLNYPEPHLAAEDPPNPFNDLADPVWARIRPVVEHFAWFRPETINHPEVQVTHRGYLDKIHILFPGYTLNEQDDAFLLHGHDARFGWNRDAGYDYTLLPDL